MKKCCRCKKNKDITNFYRSSTSKDGLRYTCKICDYDKARIYIKNNKIKCGLYQKKYYKKNKDKHYKNHIKHRSGDNGLVRIYWGIVSRCNYPSHSRFEYYGGRGIKCLWNNYQEFKNDMCKSYLRHLKKYGKIQTTIDRIDVNGDYSVKNCRWATRREQNLNKR